MLVPRPDGLVSPAGQTGPFFVPEAHPRRQGITIDCDLKDGKTWQAPVAVKGRDIWELWRLFVVQGAIGWTMPPSVWPAIASRWGSLEAALHPKRTAEHVGRLTTLLAASSGLPSADEIERGILAGQIEERLEYLRAHRPGGWEPEIRVYGAEHVEAAKSAHRGILFWGSSFAFNDLIAKIALHRLGFDVYHYTRPVHGLSNTRFGIRVLNPVRTAIECKYLAARVSGEENISGAMDVLKQHIAAGGSVSIKTGNRGKKRACAPLFGAQLELATGVVALAKRWDVPLVPTYTLRRDDGSFDFVLGKPLESSANEDGQRASEIVRLYTEQLEPLVAAEPLQWRGWRFMIPAEPVAR